MTANRYCLSPARQFALTRLGITGAHMAYEVADGAILESTIVGNHEGQVTMSVFHYRLTSTLGLPDGDAAIDAFNVEWNDLTDFVGAYVTALSQTWLATMCVYQWIYPTRFHRRTKTPAAAQGSVAGLSLPPNVSAAISKLSEKATRRSRGTLHVPGVPSSHVNSGEITLAGKALYDDLAEFMPVRYQTNTFVPILFNRTNPALSETIVEGRSELTSRVNRRRTVGLGI